MFKTDWHGKLTQPDLANSGSTHRSASGPRRLPLLCTAMLVAICLAICSSPTASAAGPNDARTQKVISRGLDWLANTQSSRGSWTANEGRYPTAMTALAGTRLVGRRLDHDAGQVSRRTSSGPSTI